MPTYTWNPLQYNIPESWSDAGNWIGGGPPGTATPPAQDLAIEIGGIASLAQPVNNVVINFGTSFAAFSGNTILITDNVEFGANFTFVTGPLVSSVYNTIDAIGLTTLDAPTVVGGISYPGATFTLNGGLTLALDAGGGGNPVITNNGNISGNSLTVSLASGTSSGSFINAGRTITLAGALQVGAGVTVGGSGVFDLSGSRANATFSGAAGAGETFAFVAQNPGTTGGQMEIADLTSFAARVVITSSNIVTIDGMASGEKSYDGNTLTFNNGKTLQLSLGPSTGGIVVVPFTGSNQTEVIGKVACFAEGTAIRTARGEAAVEALQVGELVRTASGDMRPIAWIGHRRVDCRHHPRPRDAWPVRVWSGAFGANLPARDLVLSPDHAVFVNGVLIPIRYLINGTTVVQEQAEAVSYWHIELPRHDVVFAEGLPCESYLDTGNRDAFANGGTTTQLHPDFALRIWDSEACAPLVRDGQALAAVRALLGARAEALGFTATGEPELRLIAGETVIMPRVAGGHYLFDLPAGARTVRLVTRHAVPAHGGAGSDDHRQLGVAVSRILCDGKNVPLTDAALGTGWHDAEENWRWTNGDAALDIGGARKLAVRIGMTERYWRPPEAGDSGVRPGASAQGIRRKRAQG